MKPRVRNHTRLLELTLPVGREIICSWNALCYCNFRVSFFIKDAASSYLHKWVEIIGQIKQGDSFSLKEQENLDYIIDLRVQDIMTADVVTIKNEAFIKELLDIFKETRFKSFPVVGNEKNLVGIISLVDVIKSIDL